MNERIYISVEQGIQVEKVQKDVKLEAINLNLYYNTFHALNNINLKIYDRTITAIIGPSGCGKSSLLRMFNRMNDMIPKVKITGGVIMESYDIYTEGVDVAMLRKRIGMVFQKPNVFPASIYDNIAVGPKQHGTKHKNTLDEIVETTLRQVNLWEEVKDNLRMSGLSLLPGQQQRLCIARALAVEPEVILMDESCSALDPGSTLKIEDLMLELSKEYAIMIVTHNMEQARRVSDMSIFMMIDENRAGNVVEYGNTSRMFSQPIDKRTEDYITGRFG